MAQALAGMLGVEVEHLQFLRSVPRLLLHPSVCPARREALRRRAEALYQTSDCIREVEATDDELTRLSPHEAVRDRVQNAAEKLGGAVLVIAVASALSDDPAKLYGTAGLALVFAEQHPRGPRIVGKDELLPPRPPGPPRREDADGRRLHHVPAMAAQALAALDGARESYDAPEEWRR